MEFSRIFAVFIIISFLLTIVLCDSTSIDRDDDQDTRMISKRSIFGHHKHHVQDGAQGRCVRCKFSLMRCCPPNICVKRHFRTDKCLRVKS